ncbi:hydroxymyristoyl-ACP dehydratase [Antarcticibacterium arcticum]|uniref:Hydroxymyristoyl-ACP dehydratase n=1 Tax=Antarcticibacterium arcticum TaxID=2585771 RepID=A0A5B8YKY3_9FLAO|nr:hydroxymyristoyl-ACP dehydratase [Antarcticibacterium arcticum]QED36986.1 hydroxymyristoyl-ACP dehydratase [Antarcticibacterium arcticum]
MLLKDFYTVDSTSRKGEMYATRLSINKAHEIYKGHFPDMPVTPGVILMQLFKEEAERNTGKKLLLEKASNVKFTAVVDPNKDEKLILNTIITEGTEGVNLKGTAENNNATALKINAFYKINN